MKKAYSIPAALLLVAAMAACSTENMEPDTQPQPGKQITMTATTSQPQTRLAFDDQLAEGNRGLVALTWKEGDTFVVIPGIDLNSPETFTLAGTGGKATGTFTGTLPDSDQNSWTAYYPNLYTDYTTQQQTGNANMEHLTDYYSMIGGVEQAQDTYSIQFVHDTALMKFVLTLPASLAGNEELKSLTLSADQVDWLITAYTAKGTSRGNSLTLGLKDVTPAAGNTITAYMTVCPRDPLDAGTTLTITLETNQRTHTFQHTFNQPMKYAPGKAYTATIGAADWIGYTNNMQFTIRATGGLNTFQLPFDVNASTGNYTLTVDWGDGSAPETIDPNTAARAAALTHQYETAGDYTITLRSDAQVGSEQMPRWCFDDYPTVAPMLVSMDTPMLKVGGTDLSYCFYKCSNLNNIHANLFANNTQVTNFRSCFNGCSSLAAIPEGLFNYNTQVTTFTYCFYNCTSLTTIPEGLFANNTEVPDFESCFNRCSSLTTIPEGLFDNNTAVTNFYACFLGCSSLTDIPEGLFANNTAVTDFTQCFEGCTSLAAIPEGLFANNTAVTNFRYCFNNCSSLAAIPEGLFVNNTQVTNFQTCFSGCTSLTAIPAGLFANNKAVTSFTSCFNGCTSLTAIPEALFANNTAVTNFTGCFADCTRLAAIPEGLFANNTAVTNFRSCFYSCARLTAIPKGLFDNNTAVIHFESCFRGCGSLTAIPEGLFANNTQVIDFQQCFHNCRNLVLNPNIFCTEADKSSSPRFDGITSGTINFASCFESVGMSLKAGQGGKAPALWSYPYKVGDGVSVTSTSCFRYSTKFTNVDDIPKGWR